MAFRWRASGGPTYADCSSRLAAGISLSLFAESIGPDKET